MAHVTALPMLAQGAGSNRVVKGARIEHVCGDPSLGTEKDHEFGLRIVKTALRAMQMEISQPTIFDPIDLEPNEEVVNAS